MKDNKLFIKLKSIIKKEIKNLFFIILAFIFFILDLIFFKKKNLIVFSQKNNLYSDNSRAFFEYITLEDKLFDAIWLVHDYKVKEKILLNNKKAKIEELKSFKGIKALLFAKTVVTSNSLHDFFPYFRPSFRKQAIQLWHGIKWSKHFEYPNNNFTNQLTLTCASSDSHKELIYKHNLLDPKKVFVTGLPRNDLFFNSTETELKEKLPAYLSDLKKKIILYAPTHRENLISSFFPFKDINIQELDDYLEKENLNIFLRPHINDTNKEKIAWDNYSKNLNAKNIKSLSFGELEDINRLLPFINILITDYSTIYTDALLFNVPTIFIPYDYSMYEKKRGFVYKFEEIAGGPKVFSQKELVSAINNINLNKRKFINLQEKIKKKFHHYEDGHSSMRIVNILKSNLKIK